jgi:ubiquinone/menaquinone biosynthesis C-methylase UbiE
MDSEAVKQMIEVEDRHPWYVARKTLARVWARTLLPESRGLDLGCGSGAIAEMLQREFGVFALGIDTASECLEASGNRGVEAVLADASDLPFSESTQDFVVAMDVLEHLPDQRAALLEWRRVLKSSGTLFLTVPAHQHLWSAHDRANHHYLRYSKKRLKEDLRQSGFEIKSIRYWNSILYPIFFLIRKLKLSEILNMSEFKIPGYYYSIFLKALLEFEASSKITRKFIGVSLVVEASPKK